MAREGCLWFAGFTNGPESGITLSASPPASCFSSPKRSSRLEVSICNLKSRRPATHSGPAFRGRLAISLRTSDPDHLDEEAERGDLGISGDDTSLLLNRQVHGE